jgi:hypothetical protein
MNADGSSRVDRIPFYIENGIVMLDKIEEVTRCACGRVMAIRSDDVYMVKTPISVIRRRTIYARCGNCKKIHAIDMDSGGVEIVM